MQNVRDETLASVGRFVRICYAMTHSPKENATRWLLLESPHERGTVSFA
jgi:hypothetical protein